jgi:3-isopropylmalate/(R)-2-methylmalate dehydratase small subunit
MEEPLVRRIAESAQTQRPYELTIDLETQTIADDFGFSETFAVETFRRHRLLHGLDEIGMTLLHEADIARFEECRHTFLQRGT